MSLGRPYLLIVVAFLGLSLAGAIPVTLSVRELGNLRSSIAQINESIVVARKAGALAEQIVVALMDFSRGCARTRCKRAEQRAAGNGCADCNLSGVNYHKQAICGGLAHRKATRKTGQISEILLHSLEEIRRGQGAPLTREEKIFHFLQMANSSKILREIFVEAEARAANRAEVQTKSAFARLEFTQFLLIASIALGLMLSVFGTFTNIFSYRKAKLSNIDLVAANAAMAIANDAMTRAQASLRRRERNSSWKLNLSAGSGTGAFGSASRISTGPQKPTRCWATTRKNSVRPATRSCRFSWEMGHGSSSDSQAAVMRSGEVTSVDVRMRRGDGSIGELHGQDQGPARC